MFIVIIIIMYQWNNSPLVKTVVIVIKYDCYSNEKHSIVNFFAKGIFIDFAKELVIPL